MPIGLRRLPVARHGDERARLSAGRPLDRRGAILSGRAQPIDATNEAAGVVMTSRCAAYRTTPNRSSNLFKCA